MAKEKEYAIRCFIDGKRKFTHLMTPKQAKIFFQTAGFLRKYLKANYCKGEVWR